MYTTTAFFTEETVDKTFPEDQCQQYTLETKEPPVSKDIEDFIYQVIEMENITGTFIVELVIDEENHFYGRDKYLIEPSIVFTDQPSDFIQWGDSEPDRFKIDREQSEIRFTVM